MILNIVNIQKLIKQFDGDISLVFKEIGNLNNEIIISPDRIFHSASIFKIFIAIEIIRKIKTKELKLRDKILIKNDFVSQITGKSFKLEKEDDSELSLYSSIGKTKSIKDLLFYMLCESSNLATNNLMFLLDLKSLNKTMKSIGVKKSEVKRFVQDIDAYKMGINNLITAQDIFVVFDKLINGKIFSTYYSNLLFRNFNHSKTDSKIFKHLNWIKKISHKSGSISDHYHEAALIDTESNRKFILIILTRKKTGEYKLEDFETLVTIIDFCYNLMNEEKFVHRNN